MRFNDGEIYGLDLRPSYRIKKHDDAITEQEFFKESPSPEEIEKRAKKERNTILKREKNFGEVGVNIHENFQKIDIELIEDTPISWNLFNEASDMNILDMARSIQSIGLIEPIIVSLDSKGIYTLICGRTRVLSFIRLFQETNSNKYKFIPAYILNAEEVDELFLRTLIIESNIRYRDISKINLIKSLLQNYEIMKMTKQYRNEKNLGVELAKTFEISQSSVFNFIKVKNLCDPARTLLYEERITLRAALYLARVSKETQINILERFGIKGINTIFKLKLLTSENNISIEKLEKKIKMVDELTPMKTKITVEVHRDIANPLLEHLLYFKKNEASKIAANRMKGKYNNVFKVRVNEEEMGFYIEKNIIDEKLLKKLQSMTIGEIIK